MNKFKKRVAKSFSTQFNAVVYGQGFGHLEEILNSFPSVFLINDTVPFKRKNLIFREKNSDLNSILDVGVLFIDLDKIKDIDFLMPIIIKHKPDIAIEGNECIERNYSKSLWEFNYRPRSKQGFFHVWKKIK